MKVRVLASGSKGNAVFVEADGTRLLIDAGISVRRMKALLKESGTDVASLDGVLITHEHRDHINGLAALCKSSPVPVYSRAKTLAAMFCYDKIEKEQLRRIEDTFAVGSVRVKTFNLLHDAADPVGYSIFSREGKVTVATDLGFVTSCVQEAINDTDVLILEANHDVRMLKNGRYPPSLKRRILSNHGHLSNEEAAWALVRMKRPKRLKIVLAHLSEENNRPELARETVQAIAKRQGVDLAALEIQLAGPKHAVGF